MFQDGFGNPLGTSYKPCDTVANPGGCASYEVDTLGNGFVVTDAQGFATFENLRPGKYTVKVMPPAGQGLAADVDHRGHQGNRRLGQGQRADLLHRVRPGRATRGSRVRPADQHAHARRAGVRTITGNVTNLHSRGRRTTRCSAARRSTTRGRGSL